MVKVTFVSADDVTHSVLAEAGTTLMRAAVDNNIAGIVANCGGNCACATCHVYVAQEWRSRIPAPKADERDMLECALEPNESSRLSCQVELGPELDGLTVRIPRAQA